MIVKKFTTVVLSLTILAISANAWSDQATSEIETLVDKKLEEKWQSYMKSDAFDARLEKAIVQFIETQNQRRAEQEEKTRGALTKNVSPVDASSDYIRGPVDAEFSLVEYSDYECPFCKRFHKTAGDFVAKNKEFNWVYRHFPLDFHNPGAQKESEAAECAGYVGGNDAFWSYSDKIYDRTRSNGKGFPIAKLIPLASELGLNVDEFTACFEAEKFKQKVLDQFENGSLSGVTGTPGNFLRHNASGEAIAVHGAQPIVALEKAFEELKKRIPR